MRNQSLPPQHPDDSDAKKELKRDLTFLLLMILVCGSFTGGFFVWKRKSERTGCILNIRNMQQASRGYLGMNGLRIGDPLAWSDLVGPGKMMTIEPKCPAGGKYRFLGKHPAIGVLLLECSHGDTALKHKPDFYADW